MGEPTKQNGAERRARPGDSRQAKRCPIMGGGGGEKFKRQIRADTRAQDAFVSNPHMGVRPIGRVTFDYLQIGVRQETEYPFGTSVLVKGPV